MDESSSARKWLDRFTHFLVREPENRGELVEILHTALARHLLEPDALAMIEGVLNVGDKQVVDVMVPRSQMDVIDLSKPVDRVLAQAVDTAHSRFPVIDGDHDDVIGILLAKDLLRYAIAHQSIDLRSLTRPASFVPETQRLNVLLKSFRDQRSHMAIVVDEHGNVAGLVTIEDILEQIVGEIADEHDETEVLIVERAPGRWRVSGKTELSELDDVLGTAFVSDEYRTVAGLVIDQIGHVPRRGETVDVNNWRFRVLRADRQRVHSVLVERTATA
ncbi:HlyC/CorC family transporter [Chitinibacteraceae bacterium HSL-7]